MRNASVAPSSQETGQEMLKNIDFQNIQTIVELGPGNGTITKHIINLAKPNTKILLIELEKSYIPDLQEKYGDKAIVQHGDAVDFLKYMEKHNISHADLIISTLPIQPIKDHPNFMKNLKQQIQNGAIFRGLTILAPLFEKEYEELNLQKIKLVMNNLPPVHIYGNV